jgi:hypothetical protein
MDSGPVLEGGVVWCFTLGAPEPDVISLFTRALTAGDTRWVIVPLPSAGPEVPTEKD